MATAIRTDLDFQDALRILNLPDAVASDQPATLGQQQSALAAYVLLGGAATPQIINLGTAAGATAGAISSTVHANKGSLTVGGIAFDEANGRIGIGVSLPQAKIEIADENNATFLITEYNNIEGVNLRLRRVRGSIASPAPLQSGDRIMALTAWGHNGDTIVGARAMIAAWASENWTTTANGTFISLYTTQNGSQSITERLRIDNLGNVGVGVSAFGPNAAGVVAVGNGTAPTGGATNAAQMYAVSGKMFFMDSSGAVIKMQQGAAITSPSGGAIQDAESRTAINNILSYLRASSGAGFISG